ncbi:MAG: hypothetical protein EZS28_049963, partial [Streblomastix strix]
MDSMYCTNSENLLINKMVGITSKKISFFRCHAILSNERAETYKWLFDQYINIINFEYQPSVVTDKDPANVTVQRLGNLDKAEEA